MKIFILILLSLIIISIAYTMVITAQASSNPCDPEAQNGQCPPRAYLPIIYRANERNICVWNGVIWTEPPDCWCKLYPGEPWDYVPIGCSDQPFPLPTVIP